MVFDIKNSSDFQYIDEGKGETLLLLHGLFGALSNWASVIENFSKKYRVIIPILPIYSAPFRKASVKYLSGYVDAFVKHLNLEKFTTLGNSLGGHVALVYALENPEKVDRLVLTGSSGLFENGMGGSFPKRGDYNYVKERVEYTFYDPKTATKELIDEVFEITTNNRKALNIIAIARSAQKHNMKKDIVNIKCPTLLVWGLNDMITPPEVAHEFDKLIPNTTLKFIDKCGHVPMMEQTELFNEYLKDFLDQHTL